MRKSPHPYAFTAQAARRRDTAGNKPIPATDRSMFGMDLSAAGFSQTNQGGAATSPG